MAFGPDTITEIDILLDPERLARLALPVRDSLGGP
jgi:hypothetical protein